MDTNRILVQFKNEAGEATGTPLDLPIDTTVEYLSVICNSFLNKEEPVPFLFFVKDLHIKESLHQCLESLSLENEKILDITYAAQSVFHVRPVTRCTSSIPGHAEAVISAAFSPDGRYLASGSGDTTVRLWDVNTETPQYTCQAHKHWVLCIAWAPNGKKLASGCKNNQVCIWDPQTGKQLGHTLIGHTGWISSLCWEPLHNNSECRYLASASKDCTVRIWDTVKFQILFTLTSHTGAVTCVKWGGAGLLFSSSQDRTIKVWRARDGHLYSTLKGHGHWVNTLALNTDYVLRTGPYDPSKASHIYKDITEPSEKLAELALSRYETIKGGKEEYMVSGSDDFTMYLWVPAKTKMHLARMTGHQSIINDIKFSPDGRLIASASFDKSIKIWNGNNGKFIATLHGHVQRVHQIAWSADSRLLVSGSADSTLKLWNVLNKKIAIDLPGHADEVYAVDWSPDGQRVVSGGKDKVIKIWRK